MNNLAYKSINVKYLLIISILLLCSVFFLWGVTINQPLLDLFSFRQCQTAMSSQWMEIGCGWDSIWNYKTPEFGVPWSIPFEFPFYQYIVKVISVSLHTPLDPTGRVISFLFFLGTIGLAMRFLKLIDIPIEVSLVLFILTICSPLFFYWSRTFMIESCAIFFGFLMLVALYEYLLNKKLYWLLLVALASCLCALIKVTSWPAFVFVACSLLYVEFIHRGAENKNGYFINTKLIIAILSALPLVIIWTHHGDATRESNILSSFLTSKNLSSWNFGTLSQRLSAQFWIDVISKRVIPHIIGSFWLLLCIPVGILLSNLRNRCLLGIFFIGFILPPLLFTNLHIIHTYYSYANGLWLLIALAISIYTISKSIFHNSLVVIVILVICIEVHECYTVYWPEMTTSYSNSNVIIASNEIKSKTPENSSIVIIGDDWSPELGYYSKRRSIYFPNWMTKEQVQAAFSKLIDLAGDYPVAAVVYQRNNPACQKLIDDSSNIELWARTNGDHVKCGSYDIYILNKTKS